VIRLAKNKDALVLELIEMSPINFRHDMFLIESVTKLATNAHRFTQNMLGCSFRNLCFIRVNLWLVFSCDHSG
jgi:hypothetical protein